MGELVGWRVGKRRHGFVTCLGGETHAVDGEPHVGKARAVVGEAPY